MATLIHSISPGRFPLVFLLLADVGAGHAVYTVVYTFIMRFNQTSYRHILQSTVGAGHGICVSARRATATDNGR